MSGLDKNRQRNHTISFRVSQTEAKELEARIEASGLTKNQYYIHSCLYGRIVVVGSRQNIDRLIDCVHDMELMLKVLLEEAERGNVEETTKEIQRVKEEYCEMIKAILDLTFEANIQVQK